MTRVFIDLVPEQGQLVELNQELTRHLRDVLRLQEGSQITVISRPVNQEFLAIIAAARKDKPLSVKIVKAQDRIIASPLVSSLICGLPKGSHADQICEQVSQLGISRIVFWIADRSVANPRQAETKLERWQKIAESSARQSNQSSIPEVSFFAGSDSLFQWLKAECLKPDDLLAICSLSQNAEAVSSIKAPSGRVHMVVGPEGDFSEEEINLFDQSGARHVSLGPLVLRVETAALAAVAMGLAVWGWKPD